MEWACLGCDIRLVITSQHLECLVAAQSCSMCRIMNRNCWDEKQVWWAPAVVKHKERMRWFLVLVGNLDRPAKWDKDFQSSEPEAGYAGYDSHLWGRYKVCIGFGALGPFYVKAHPRVWVFSSKTGTKAEESGELFVGICFSPLSLAGVLCEVFRKATSAQMSFTGWHLSPPLFPSH